MFAVCLRHADHVRQYVISNRSAAGWEVRREEDHTLQKHVWYRDWHRVELSMVQGRQPSGRPERQQPEFE